MKLVFPIRLEEFVLFSEPSPRTRRAWIQEEDLQYRLRFLRDGGGFARVGGWDSSHENGREGVRLTDLCGVRDGAILKFCPACRRERPLDEFGLRTMTETHELRVQSHCMRCRQKSG